MQSSLYLIHDCLVDLELFCSKMELMFWNHLHLPLYMAKPNVDFSNEENWLPPKVAPSALVIIACHMMCFSFPFDVNSWYRNGYLSWKETLLAQFTRMFAHHP
jgi:hypothetical protein